MRTLLIFSAVVTALAQTVEDPQKLPDRLKNFERAAAGVKLQCRIAQVEPRLNLGFRFQAGYVVEIPLRQYSGESARLSTVVRVTPGEKEHEPTWLLSQVKIPATPEKKAIVEFGGAYLVGEGKYRVDVMLIDDRDRVCMKGWNIHAKLGGDARTVRPGLPPGSIDDISLRRWQRTTAVAGEAPRYNISVLLHAAAVTPNRMRLRGYDRMLLMSALSSMVERLPVRNVRLTVFNMDRQKELYHTGELSARTFRAAINSMAGLELGIVDYATLQRPTGHLDLVSDLLAREISAKDRPDAIIFLGPLARWTGSVPDESIPFRERIPPVYYVQLRPWRAHSGMEADTIARTVRKLGGRTKQVYSPEDFAEAIREAERLLVNSDQ